MDSHCENSHFVYLAAPAYAQVHPGSAHARLTASSSERIKIVHPDPVGMSALAQNFNHHWVQALNNRNNEQMPIDRFVMQHSDIQPIGEDWVVQMSDELDRSGADILGVVAPLKSPHGLTSTAMVDLAAGHIRRLTMKEIFQLPETFTTEDVRAIWKSGANDQSFLVLNTGLWICRFTEPWVERVWFEIRNRIVRDGKGNFSYIMMPEDWNFSIMAQKLGCKLACTRKIRLVHFGEHGFRNDHAWGTAEHDAGYSYGAEFTN